MENVRSTTNTTANGLFHPRLRSWPVADPAPRAPGVRVVTEPATAVFVFVSEAPPMVTAGMLSVLSLASWGSKYPTRVKHEQIQRVDLDWNRLNATQARSHMLHKPRHGTLALNPTLPRRC